LQKSKCPPAERAGKMTMENLKWAVWILFFCGYTFQCSSSKKEITVNSNYNPYFPSSVGNYWEYINQAPREETELWKVEIREQKSEAGNKVYTFSSFPFFYKEQKQTNVRIKEDGSVYLSDTNKIIPETANLKKDYTWNFGIWNGYIAGTNETVKAENQTFTDCIKINYAASITFSAEIWLAKNTGIVKWGFFRTNPPTLTFTYYVLKKSTIN
jgi:hypothetical protein